MTPRHSTSFRALSRFFAAILFLAPASPFAFARYSQSRSLPQPADSADPTDTFSFIRSDLSTFVARLGAITSHNLEFIDDSSTWKEIRIEDCVALINTSLPPRAALSAGLVTLNNGQRIPGEIVLDQTHSADAIAWNHSRLGRLSIPINSLASIAFRPDVPPPPPGASDVLLLSNGDRLEGFILSIADPISLELPPPPGAAARQVSQIPLARAAALTMVAQNRPVTGRRLWLDDGTVIDVSSLAVGLDGQVRISSPLFAQNSAQPATLPLDHVAAVLLAPHAVIPLASLAPADVSGPATRFTVPPPRLLDAASPLGSPRIAFSGPVKVRYTLPADARRFSATASLAPSAQTYGDCELIISSDNIQLARLHLHSANPSASLNVPLAGSDLTIEIAAAANGSIQDHVVLSLAFLGIQPPAR